ncbi:hypothetical protein F5B21DRAFT_21015 [Xylaria acuta]|nr:hypothetical protein F5B21DRAFT_21015 [Xylaria acuta]
MSHQVSNMASKRKPIWLFFLLAKVDTPLPLDCFCRCKTDTIEHACWAPRTQPCRSAWPTLTGLRNLVERVLGISERQP